VFRLEQPSGFGQHGEALQTLQPLDVAALPSPQANAKQGPADGARRDRGDRHPDRLIQRRPIPGKKPLRDP
jgi:hypothetical protein